MRVKDHKQRDIFDPWQHLSPKRRRMLDEGWPGLFRKHLLNELPVEKIIPFFREDFGRPGKELYTLLGVLLFQQTMDLNDIDTIEQLSFNIQWHYALNITEESDSAKYISEKTLWSWRQLLIEHQLDRLIFNNISEKLAKVFHVDTSNQRIDSVHIQSNMRRLGRILMLITARWFQERKTIFSDTAIKIVDWLNAGGSRPVTNLSMSIAIVPELRQP
jgi:hypothetical protein